MFTNIICSQDHQLMQFAALWRWLSSVVHTFIVTWQTLDLDPVAYQSHSSWKVLRLIVISNLRSETYFVDDFTEFRYCKCCEKPLCYDPLRFSLSFSDLFTHTFTNSNNVWILDRRFNGWFVWNKLVFFCCLRWQQFCGMRSYFGISFFFHDFSVSAGAKLPHFFTHR